MDAEPLAGRHFVDAVNPALDIVGRLGVVPVTTIANVDEATLVGEALAAAGLPCIEVTLRTPAGLAAITRLARTAPGLLLGAGTVLSVAQAADAVDAGARFLASPGYDDAVVDWCLANEVLMLPGVMTPSEMMRAMRAGLDVVKFFPARTAGGPAAIAAAAAVFPELRFVPTGGIGPADAAGYLALPSVAAVGGSWMVARELIERGDRGEIERRARDAVRTVAEARS